MGRLSDVWVGSVPVASGFSVEVQPPSRKTSAKRIVTYRFIETPPFSTFTVSVLRVLANIPALFYADNIRNTVFKVNTEPFIIIRQQA